MAAVGDDEAAQVDPVCQWGKAGISLLFAAIWRCVITVWQAIARFAADTDPGLREQLGLTAPPTQA